MSDTTNVSIDVKCPSCGGDFEQFSADPKPDDMIVCRGCGAKIRYADFQAIADNQVAEALDKAIRDMLKGSGFE